MTSLTCYLVLKQPGCAYCERCIDLLRQHKINFTTHNLDGTTSAWLKTLVKMAGLTTVPQVFDYRGEHIGGYEELKAHLGDT